MDETSFLVWKAAFWLVSSLLAIATAILAGFVKWLHGQFKDVDTRERELTAREAAFEAKCATEFVTKAELNRKGDQLRGEFATVHAKIEALKNRI